MPAIGIAVDIGTDGGATHQLPIDLENHSFYAWPIITIASV